MNDRKLIWAGGAGSVIAAICCFTPVLVIALGALGLSALTGYFDYVLFLVLAISLTVLGYGLHLRRQRLASCREMNVTSKPERT